MKSTQLAQISLTKDHTGATTNPIYLATAYQHEKLGCSTGFDYTRTKNPTRSQFEEAFAKLEGGKYSFATSSGMASIQLICNLFKPNDEILVSFDLYGALLDCLSFTKNNTTLNLNTSIFQILKKLTHLSMIIRKHSLSNQYLIH